MPIDRRDQLSFDMTPTVMVPRFGELEQLAVGRVRYLAARDGLFVEARSRSAHACLLVAPAMGELPYGDVRPFWKPAGGEIPLELVTRFVSLARADATRELAALILWKDDRYQLYVPPVQETSSARVRYSIAAVDPQDVVVDIHSHGRMSAHFSGQDDADDAANPSLCFSAMVVGTVDQLASSETRIVVNGWATSELELEARQLRYHAEPAAADDEPTFELRSAL